MQTTPSAATQQHQIIPPHVPEAPEHNNQRTFSRRHGSHGVKLTRVSKPDEFGWTNTRAEVNVFRWAENNEVELSLSISANRRNNSTTTVACTAPELREIAARLLDAAHDLEAFPASVLMQAAA